MLSSAAPRLRVLPSPEGEEISVQLSVQRQGYTIIPAVLVDNDIYLPILDIFSFLKIKSEVKAGMKFISGFFINEENKYFIDIDKGIIQNGAATIAIVRSDFIFSESNVFMRRELFEKAFGLTCKFNFRALEVLLTTDLQLPIIREMMRERERQNLQHVNDLTFVADRTLPKKHSWLQGAVLDWSVQNIYAEKSNTQLYSFASGAEIFGGDLDAFFDASSAAKISSNDLNWRWRYVDVSSSFFQQAILGYISTLSLASHYGSIVGVQVTNSPPTYRRAYGTYLIHDYTQPDWIVELYVNQQLVDFVKADAAGLYQFAIPLSYGPTYVTLKFYGPWGEERSQEKLISIPYTFIPAGEIEYTLSAGRSVAENNKEIGQFNLQTGLTSYLTIGGGVEYFQSPNVKPITPFASLTYRLADELIFTGEYADRNYSRGLLSYTHPSQFGVELGYTKFSQYSQSNYSSQIEERKATLTIPIRFATSRMLSRIRIQQNIFAESKNIYSEASLSGSLFGIQTNLTGLAQFTSMNNTTSSYIRSLLALSFRTVADITLRPQAEYDISNGQFTYIRTYIERQIFDVGWLSIIYEYNIANKSNFAQLDFRYDLPFTQLNSSSRYSTQQSAYSQSARGTVGFDSHSQTILADNRNWVRRGAITLRPFLDSNNNDIMDPDEQPVQNLDIAINGGRIITSGDKTVIRIVDLQPYTTYLLSITSLNFENLSWKPKYKSYSITADANQFKEIQIPILITGEVNGTVRKRTISGDKGLGGVRVFFKQLDGNFSDKTLTFSEGEFNVSGLLPGHYSAFIDTMQLQKLSLISDPQTIDFQIHSITEGDVVDKIDFVLKTVIPAIAANIDTTVSQQIDTSITPLPPKHDTTATVVTIKRLPTEAPIEIGIVKSLSMNFRKRSLDSTLISYLDRIVNTWKSNQTLIVVVEGHTDNFGTFQEKQTRSLERANQVRVYLSQHGIKANNIQSRGFGDRKPIATNLTAVGRAKNNRVDISIISNK